MTCKDKVALVTGSAGGGMGRSIALTLAREGAKVVVNYRKSKAEAEAIVEHIVHGGGSAAVVQGDVFTREGCRELVERTLDLFARVDICIIGPGGGWHPEPLVELNPAGALEDLHSELAPFYYLMPLVLPGMYERKWGRIIGLGLHPTQVSPAYAYNAAKAARTQALLLSYLQTWQQGVTINVIAPGPVPPVESLAEAVELCDHGPAWQGRSDVTPQDIAEGAAFLCSEAGGFITGAVLPYLFKG